MLKNIPLIIVLAASLTACGGSDDKKSSNKSSAALSSSAPAASSEPAVSSAPASSAVASSVATSIEASSSSVNSSVASSEPAVSSVAASEAASSAASSEASSSSSDASVLTVDFEEDAVDSTYGSLGWSSPAVNATVVTLASVSGLPANEGSNNILRVVALDWDSLPTFQVTLPQGKTLADYEVKVDAYFPRNTLGLTDEADNYYKSFLLLAGTAMSGGAKTDNAAYHSKIETIYNDIDAWKTFTLTVDATKGASLTGAFNIAVGISRQAGTNADAYYFDNIRLVELP